MARPEGAQRVSWQTGLGVYWVEGPLPSTVPRAPGLRDEGGIPIPSFIWRLFTTVACPVPWALMETYVGGGEEGLAVGSTPTTGAPEHQLHGAGGLGQALACGTTRLLASAGLSVVT